MAAKVSGLLWMAGDAAGQCGMHPRALVQKGVQAGLSHPCHMREHRGEESGTVVRAADMWDRMVSGCGMEVVWPENRKFQDWKTGSFGFCTYLGSGSYLARLVRLAGLV